MSPGRVGVEEVSEVEVVGWSELAPAGPRLLLLLLPPSVSHQPLRASAQGRAGPAWEESKSWFGDPQPTHPPAHHHPSLSIDMAANEVGVRAWES